MKPTSLGKPHEAYIFGQGLHGVLEESRERQQQPEASEEKAWDK